MRVSGFALCFLSVSGNEFSGADVGPVSMVTSAPAAPSGSRRSSSGVGADGWFDR